jgi:hypothetical protein
LQSALGATLTLSVRELNESIPERISGHGPIIVNLPLQRMPCVIEGRFFLSQAQNFISESSSPPVRIGKITINIGTISLKRAGAFDAFRPGEMPK